MVTGQLSVRELRDQLKAMTDDELGTVRRNAELSFKNGLLVSRSSQRQGSRLIEECSKEETRRAAKRSSL